MFALRSGLKSGAPAQDPTLEPVQLRPTGLSLPGLERNSVMSESEVT